MAEPLARAKPKPKAIAVKAPQPVAAEHASAIGGLDHGESGGGTSALAAIHALGAQPAMRLDRIDDPWEHEAERVADHVTDGPAGVAPPIISRLEPGALRPISRMARDDAGPLEDDGAGDDSDDHGMPIQRACCEGCAHGGPCAGTPHVEREREPGMAVQRQSIIDQYESIIRLKRDCEALDARGPGTVIPAPTLRTLEPRMGIALAGVRVHQGSDAAEKARGLGARAFTQGRDIFLGSGESPDDTSLMAHEATHVVQQGAVPRAAPPTHEDAPPQGKAAGGKEPVAGPPVPAVVLGPAGPPYIPDHRVAPPPDISIHMPEPPEAPSRAARRRLSRVSGAMAHNAKAQAKLPTGDVQVTNAHETVDQPETEAQANANSDQTESLLEIALPDAQIEALCGRIRLIIRCKRPPDEDSLVDAEPEKMAHEAGDALNDDVKGAVDKSSNVYGIEDFDAKAKAPVEGGDLTPQPDAERVPQPSAAQAVPEAVPPEHVSLDADVSDSDAKMREAGMDTPSARLVEDGPIADARGSRDELARMAVQDTAKVIAAEEQARTSAAADMAAFQRESAASLVQARSQNVVTIVKHQGDAKESEETTRDRVSELANKAYGAAQTFVTEKLTKLPQIAMAKWDAGVNQLTGEFKRTLAKTRKSIDERHSGVLGSTLVAAWDWGTGLPGWVTDTYDKAEKDFGDGICKLASEVSSDVNTAVRMCQDRIAFARMEIHVLFASLGGGLAVWAATEEAKFNRQLTGLQKQAETVRRDFTKQLVERAGQAVQEVREQIYALRQEAMGLIGRIADHINRFLNDPVRYIINGLLRLLGIAPAAFWRVVERVREVIDEIVDDPLPFANNLASAVGRGFDLFFQHLPKHLVQGFLKWLFGNVEGLEVPRDFSLRSVLTFFLQLMGITWQRVRAILAKHLGERNVALVEKAWGLFANFIKRGWDGLVDLVKGALDPMQLIGKVIDSAVEYVSQQIVERAAARLAAMFVPGGAILQAIEIIYRILKWIFQNAAKIWTLIETIVGGLRDILSGAIEGLARRIETALANLIPAVISFIAGFFGLDDLPKKVSETVRGMREWVEGLMERAVVAVVNAGKRLLERAGLRRDEPEKPGDGDTELGETVRFQEDGSGEWHRLWVRRDARGATLMVASDTPTPLLDKLADWTRRLDTLREQENGEALHAEAGRLLPAARTLLTQADSEADRISGAEVDAAAREAQDRVRGPRPSDDMLVSEERQLSVILRRLFAIFDEKPDEKQLKELLSDAEKLRRIAAVWPGYASGFVGAVHEYWLGPIRNIKIPLEPDTAPSTPPVATTQPLWEEDVLMGSQAAALRYLQTPPVQHALFPYFSRRELQRNSSGRVIRTPDVRSDEFGNWVFRSGDGPRGVRATFLETLGAGDDAAAPRLKREGHRRIGEMQTSERMRERVRKGLDELTYSVGVPPYGRFQLPTAPVPDHNRFEPVSVLEGEKSGRPYAFYKTRSGQQFLVLLPNGEINTQIVRGRGLSLMVGRGVTERSPLFEENRGFNSAHVIANRFGGSGYESSRNLVTTSWQYNQEIMAAHERRVVAVVEEFARQWMATAPPQSLEADKHIVTFDMTITVTFGLMTDAIVLAQIEQQEWYRSMPDRPANLRHLIEAKLAGDLQNLRRVTRVEYTIDRMRAPDGSVGGGRSLLPLGPDLWILVGPTSRPPRNPEE